jgi:subtilisin-like proprotein convertase family protein
MARFASIRAVRAQKDITVKYADDARSTESSSGLFRDSRTDSMHCATSPESRPMKSLHCRKAYLPLLASFTMACPAFAVVESFSSSPGAAIPDNGGPSCNRKAGDSLMDVISVPSEGTINDVDVGLDISHTYVGDLVVTLTSPQGTKVTLVQLIGNDNTPGEGGCGCLDNDITTTLDDDSTVPIEDYCRESAASYSPQDLLSAFDGEDLAGGWTIEVTDWTFKDDGKLNSWELMMDYEVNEPPDCSGAEPSISLLWPANHKFVPVDIMGVTDPDDDTVTFTIESIFQDEAVDAKGSGKTAPDGRGVGTSSAEVRAERSGKGNGRVYHIGFAAADGNGGTCVGDVTVEVPHDKGRWSVAVDEGAFYDSTGVP